MSILFKGNLEEGNYTLIKSTDGWVLKGKISYVGFNFIDKPQGEWTNAGVLTVHCSNCKSEFHELEAMNFCPNCGADMRGEEE